MELDEFEIGEFRAGPRRQHEALSDAAGWIGAVGVEAADAAGRDHDRRGRQEDRPRGADRDHAAHAVLDNQPTRLDPLENRDRGRRAGRRDERAHDFAPRAVAAGMNDASACMSRLEPQREGAVASPVEARAEPGEGLDRRWGGAGKECDDAHVAKPVAGRDRVGRVQGRGVVGTERRRHAALRHQARAFCAERRLGEHDDRARREHERRRQACHPGADDDNAGAERQGLGGHSASIRSTARRAAAAIAGSIVTSPCMVSSARRIFDSVIRFMCGQSAQGRTKSISG